MKRAVLIVPTNDYAHRTHELARTSWPFIPPLGFIALGSYMHANGVPVELIDVAMDFGIALTSEAEPALARRVVEHLRSQADDIGWIGISQMSNAMLGVPLAEAIAVELPEIPIVFGGYFPSLAAPALLRSSSAIKAVVRGDGEHAALAISRSIAEGRSFLSDETPNLVWREGDAIYSSPPRRVTPGELPIWDFTLLHNATRYPVICIMTSRGCSFDCNYCVERRMRPYIEQSPEWVERQLLHLEGAVPNSRISVQDPIFGLHKQRTFELLERFRGRRFTYATSTRANVFSPDLLPAMRAAGFEVLNLGLESASPSTLVRMNKVPDEARAHRYVAQAEEIVEGCFRNDITPFIALMLAFPGDTEADYQATFEFIKRIRASHDEIARVSDKAPGFYPTMFPTYVYDGSRLSEIVDHDFPDAVLDAMPFIGERVVRSPGPGIDDASLERCRFAFGYLAAITPRALERIEDWFWASYSVERFVAAHPELTDAEGVTVFGDAFKRFTHSFVSARG